MPEPGERAVPETAMQTDIIEQKPVASPTTQKERIFILDGLRGIAVFGILLMNIAGFGLPFYNDPSPLDETGINYKAWYIMEWLFDGTQRGLFSLLFGAGVVLFIRNLEKRLPGLQPADIFFRRQLWLLVFGLINIYIFLWSGDILFDYACLGMLLFVFRNWTSRNLLIAGIVCMFIMTARENYSLYQDKKIISRGEAIAAIDTTKTPLSLLQKEDLEAMQEFRQYASLQSKKSRAEKAIAKMTADYRWVYDYRTTRYFSNFMTITYLGLWDVLQFMFMGMAFFKSGLLLGKASRQTYLWMMVGGLGIGTLLSYFRVEHFTSVGFNYFEHSRQALIEFYNLDRTFRTLGMLGGLLLLYRSGLFNWLFRIFQPAGQMAFSNYLMQSIFGAMIFYGFGLALFGQLERYQLYLVVLAICTFQLIFSHVWIRYYQFGPFEWVWRSLTYWKKQPMKRPRQNDAELIAK